MSTHFVAPYFMLSSYCSCFLCGHIRLVSCLLLLLVQWVTRYFPSFMLCMWDIGHGTHINFKPLIFNHICPTCKCFVFFSILILISLFLIFFHSFFLSICYFKKLYNFFVFGNWMYVCFFGWKVIFNIFFIHLVYFALWIGHNLWFIWIDF